MDLPLRKRCNIKSIAASLNISKSSVHRLVKWGKIKRHTSTFKPVLTIKNKIQRLSYQYVMKEILKYGGGNNFNMPHAANHRLEREGTLPTIVSVSTQIVSNAIKSLLEQFQSLQTEQTETEQQHTMAEANNQNQYLATQEMETWRWMSCRMTWRILASINETHASTSATNEVVEVAMSPKDRGLKHHPLVG
ncbi:Ribonucleoside-diphosphate reductase subunit beta [Bienertia sinuspersici]